RPVTYGLRRSPVQSQAKVHSMTGQSEADYTQRHATYDLKKLRGKDLITKMGRSRRYEVSTSSMHAITALQVLRHHVVRPVLAGVQAATQRDTQPKNLFHPRSHYERLRLDPQSVFQELGIAA